METETNDLSSWFIGAQAENRELFEQLLLEFTQDHMYWRRNFHPDDPPSISALSTQSPEFQANVARMKDELHALSAALKSSVPLSSPRYMGHMLSDPLIPGLLAQMLALPYNPNNVSEEAAPVTIDLEIKVGLQLARMLGYNDDPNRAPCAFGYLTAGGTLANYQALQVLRSVKYYPLALYNGMTRMKIAPPAGGTLHSIIETDPTRLANLSVPESIEAYEAWHTFLREEQDPAWRAKFAAVVQGERLESMGTHAFFSAHRDHCSVPTVLVANTAHYSWIKAMRLLGIGESGLVRVATHGMRLDPDALEHALMASHKLGQNILCVVGVLGTTEYGTLDPLHEIVAARDRWSEHGLGFAVHADAAWGGYLATLFRDGNGALLTRDEVAKHFKYFPSEATYAAFSALGRADSVTVDPHKLGYLPYGVGGAYVCRDHRCMDFITADAPYLGRVRPQQPGETDYYRKFRRLGSYILEGSKPGFAAAAAYVTHRLLPLDSEHFGKLLRYGVQNAEYFCDRINALRERVKDQVRVSVPIEPDSSLVCIAFNPVGNDAVAVANAFTADVFEHLRIDRTVPLQARAFFGSSTVLYRRMLQAGDTAHILGELGLANYTFTESPKEPERYADGLLILRHTLMNPWLRDNVNHIDYIEKYCLYLEQLLRDTAARKPLPHITATG
ncbi:MAG: pyridoxal-dependent decarboxylase [Gammaproteobacteria bacterium]